MYALSFSNKTRRVLASPFFSCSPRGVAALVRRRRARTCACGGRGGGRRIGEAPGSERRKGEGKWGGAAGGSAGHGHGSDSVGRARWDGMSSLAARADTRRRLSGALYSVLRDGCLRGDSVDDDAVELIAETVLEEPAGALSLRGRDHRGAAEILAELLIDTISGFVEDTDELIEGWDESEMNDNVEELLDTHMDWVVDVVSGEAPTSQWGVLWEICA